MLPMKQTLMRRLVTVQDMQKMQRLLEANTAVQGERTAILDLAVIFLEMGRYLQVRERLLFCINS